MTATTPGVDEPLGARGSLVRGLGSSRIGVLLVARVVEQAALGLATLLLARWLGVVDFAPVSALLLFNSFAIVASDLGIGLCVLGGAVGAVGVGQVRRVRAVNLVVVAVGMVGALALTGPWRATAMAAGLIWATSGEAFIRKSALLRMDRQRRVALIEVIASLVFGAVVLVVALAPGRAAILVGAALVTKHLLEVALSRGWRRAVSAHGRSSSGTVWWTQVLAYLTANVDFVVVGIMVSAAAFSVYSLGFRVAALVASQVGYAVGRVSMVDLAQAVDRERRQAIYHRLVRLLFLAGVAAGIISSLAALVLPTALGGEWRDIAWVVVLLSLGTPWRMALGLSGSMMITQGRAPTLVRWELIRLVVTGLVLLVAGSQGLWVFAGAATVVIMVSSVLLDRGATALAGLRRWRVPGVLLLPGLIAVVGSVQIARGGW